MEKNIRVLVCDEDKKFRSSLASLMTQKGFETYQAKSGFHALNMMEERKFDVLILADQMIEMGALEVINISKDKIDVDDHMKYLIVGDQQEEELKDFPFFKKDEGPSELVLKIQLLLAPPKKKQSSASNALSKFFGSKKS